MTRMRLDRFRPRRAAPVRRLGLPELESVKRLYGMWTDQNQLPAQLSQGVYYGVYAGSELVSVAGTHCVSSRYGGAAIGNVLTHISYRNRGLAATTTSAVVEELQRLGCDELVLNVRDGNDSARAAYQRLGFTPHCEFIEGVFPSRILG